MNGIHTSLLLTALFLTLAPIAPASTTWYVNGVSGSDSNNCMSLSTPCQTIGHAISLAASGDSIMVAAATYKEHLVISVNLSITGAAATNTVIDGGRSGTVLTIASATAHVTVANVTVTDGLAPGGGGIYNRGLLVVKRSVITGNVASHPTGCKVGCGGHGGGISNDGTLTLNNSSVMGNTATIPKGCILGCAFGGGGLSNNCCGTVSINSSTISKNVASDPFNITRNGAGGGGILNGGTITINSSTLANNSATGCCAGIANESTAAQPAVLKISNSTFANNTLVNYTGGDVSVQNSIFTGSSNCAGTIKSNGYNLSSDGTCSFTNIGDLNNTDPMLGPLQNNGGPTQTMALPSGSPAIDAGNPSGCTDSNGHLLTTDQRGMPRPDKEDSVGCDIGAYESQAD